MEKLTAQVDSLAVRVDGLTTAISDLKHVVEIDADNIRRLANMAAAHDDGIDDLRTRLDRLERKAAGTN